MPQLLPTQRLWARLKGIRSSLHRPFLDRGVPVCPTLGRSLIGAKHTLKQLSLRPTNDRRLKDLTGLVPQSGGLFVALSLEGRSQ
jgi:hypothetical protein